MTPDKYTIKELFLDVGNGHELYIQEWGNPKAKTPIVFLHGGPGSGVNDGYKGMFDPARHRVVFYDQRGAGQSIPRGSREHNTTQDLVDDIEKIAKRLKLDKFVLVGGSWGVCLALAYGLKYPQRVVAMVLRGIFTGSRKEIDFLDKGEFRSFFPDVWETYLSRTPKKWQNNPGAYHGPRALGPDPAAATDSAYTYRELEAALLNLDDRYTPLNPDDFDPNGIALEIYYTQNNCFLPDNYILDNAHKLKMPIWLIQGRYDIVCPPITAYELHKRLPNSQLIWTTAGHGNDRPNYDVNRTILLQWS